MTENERYTLGMLEILYRPNTICFEGYRARWSPATYDDPGEWYYDSRYDPVCPHCNGEGCDVIDAREEFDAEAFDAIEYSTPASQADIEALHP